MLVYQYIIKAVIKTNGSSHQSASMSLVYFDSILNVGRMAQLALSPHSKRPRFYSQIGSRAFCVEFVCFVCVCLLFVLFLHHLPIALWVGKDLATYSIKLTELMLKIVLSVFRLHTQL